jgi:arylsulfatase A-like enzyme
VPGIVRWPGRIEPGTVTDTPAGVVDLLPTFCEAAGVAPDGKPLDGTSLLPLFGGEPLARAKPLYWFYSPSHPDLASAIATAFAHTAPGGMALFQPSRTVNSSPLAKPRIRSYRAAWAAEYRRVSSRRV